MAADARANTHTTSSDGELVAASEVSQLSDHATDFGLAASTRHGSESDTVAPFDDDPLLGQTVGDVVIEAVIAEGGMGRVYRGRQTHPPRPVAIKFMRHARKAALTERFRREVEVLGRLVHPNIAQVYTAGEVRLGLETLPFFVMEFIPDAKTLLRYCTTQDLSVREKLDLFLDACDAVAAGHRQGIVHRDLKPGNILVADDAPPTSSLASDTNALAANAASPKPRVKVIDFGIAKAATSHDETGHGFTETGEFLGTRQYMSPEQFDGRPGEIDARSDVYSLGVVLQQLLTGRLPHDLANRSLVETARIVQEQPPARLVLQARGVDRRMARQLQTVVSRCLEKRAAQRYPDAGSLAADLRRVVAGDRLTTRGRFATASMQRHVGLAVTAVTLIAVVAVAILIARPLGLSPTRSEETAVATLGPQLFRGGFTTKVSSGRTTPVEWVQLEFERPLAAALTLDNFQLTRNGSIVDLSTASLIPLASGGRQWIIENLGLTNAQQGDYELRLIEKENGPVTSNGDRFQGTTSLNWTMPPFTTFRFNLQDDAWDDHVVSIEGLERYQEKTADTPCIFIRPTAIGEEGTIVMRYPVNFPIHAASLTAAVSVWTTGDPFPYDPAAWASLDVSADGETWTNLVTRGPNRNLKQRPPFDILPIVEGAREVWIRAQLTGTKEWPGDGITFSQFLRTEVGDPTNVFQLDVTGPHPPVIPASSRDSASDE